MLANTKQTIANVRDAGGIVVHAPITFVEGYGELSPEPYGILKGVAIVEDVAPQPGDIVVEGKRGLDAFASTNLDFMLRSRGITTIALGGFLTNCCVESTMRTAYEKGYNVMTSTDCTATVAKKSNAQRRKRITRCSRIP